MATRRSSASGAARAHEVGELLVEHVKPHELFQGLGHEPADAAQLAVAISVGLAGLHGRAASLVMAPSDKDDDRIAARIDAAIALDKARQAFHVEGHLADERAVGVGEVTRPSGRSRRCRGQTAQSPRCAHGFRPSCAARLYIPCCASPPSRSRCNSRCQTRRCPWSWGSTPPARPRATAAPRRTACRRRRSAPARRCRGPRYGAQDMRRAIEGLALGNRRRRAARAACGTSSGLHLARIGARGMQGGAAEAFDGADLLAAERARPAVLRCRGGFGIEVEQPGPTAANPRHVPTLVRRPVDDGLDTGIEAGNVAAAGQRYRCACRISFRLPEPDRAPTRARAHCPSAIVRRRP